MARSPIWWSLPPVGPALAPTLGFAVCALITFALLTYALRHLEFGPAYAVWTGMGAAGTALVGMALLGESVSAAKLISIELILARAIGLNLSGVAPVSRRSWLPIHVLKPEGEQRAGADGFAGIGPQWGRYRLITDDGEPPVVEGDQLRQRLGAQAPALAGDEVHPQPSPHRGPGDGTGRTWAVPLHDPAACWLSSVLKVRRALRTRRTAPLG
jgi:quaternary ammonium compound-resistance protein SugE